MFVYPYSCEIASTPGTDSCSQAYTQRINEVNSTLHMVLELNPDAEHIARELDFERWRGHSRGLVIFSHLSLTEAKADV